MAKIIRDVEFQELLGSQPDPVVRNALAYGGERIFFVHDIPNHDFDLHHFGRLIVDIFHNHDHLYNQLNMDNAMLPSLGEHDFDSKCIRVTDALEFSTSRSLRLQNWLSICLDAASRTPLESDTRFDLLFFCKTMEQFFWDGSAVAALLRGEDVGGAFDVD